MWRKGDSSGGEEKEELMEDESRERLLLGETQEDERKETLVSLFVSLFPSFPSCRRRSRRKSPSLFFSLILLAVSASLMLLFFSLSGPNTLVEREAKVAAEAAPVEERVREREEERDDILFSSSPSSPQTKEARGELRFANVFGSHMVLQKAPSAIVLWGYYVPPAAAQQGEGKRERETEREREKVLVIVTSSAFPKEKFRANLTARAGSSPPSWRWEARLPPLSPSNTSYTFTVLLEEEEERDDVEEEEKIQRREERRREKQEEEEEERDTKKDSSSLSLQDQLEDVLIGDVWVCSGQSNMQYNLFQAFGGPEAVKDGERFSLIRVMSLSPLSSPHPLEEALAVQLPWSLPSPTSLRSTDDWGYFSAMCWFYGLRLYKELGYPLGLIQSAVGGTPIRSWSSPEALAQCAGPSSLSPSLFAGEEERREHSLSLALFEREEQRKREIRGGELSVLWNSMILPLTTKPIFGLIWYQGEADSDDDPSPQTSEAQKYSCRFPAFLADLRRHWHNPDLPLGFVQLSTWDDHDNSTCGTSHARKKGCGTALVRWGQTGGMGYVPNIKMPRTFMAVAMDYGDPIGVSGDIHPRYKAPVAERLALGALTVGYGRKGLHWSGPRPTSAAFDPKNHWIVITFDNLWGGLEVRTRTGFQLKIQDVWEDAEVEGLSEDASAVFVRRQKSNKATDGEREEEKMMMSERKEGGERRESSSSWWTEEPTAVRYNWYRAPCAPLTGTLLCALYSKDGDQPVGPFVMDVKQ